MNKMAVQSGWQPIPGAEGKAIGSSSLFRGAETSQDGLRRRAGTHTGHSK